jgi:uncharacterized protein (DUF2267 family)
MPYEQFLAAVRERGGYTTDDAERVTGAVVATLGDRLTAEAAEHLADQLPMPLAEILGDARAAPHNWGVREFVGRVAELTGDDETSAEVHARAVLSALADQVSGGERNKLLSRLPSGYAELFGFPELT